MRCHLLFLLPALCASIVSAADPPPGLEKAPGLIERARPKTDGHWGEEAVGFRWEEVDSRDARWNDMETGPFMTSALAVPGEMITKALSIRLGPGRDAAVCYDLKTMKLGCGWTGGFLNYTPARYGLIAPPKIAGKVRFDTPEGPAWGSSAVEYNGLHLHGNRVVLSYAVDGVDVLDSPWFHSSDEKESLFLRTLQVAASDKPLTLTVANPETPVAIIVSSNAVTLTSEPDQPVFVTIAPRKETVRFTLVIAGSGQAQNLDQLVASLDGPDNLDQRTEPGPPLWDQPVVTKGQVSPRTEAYVVDTVSLPFENPWKALMFVGGHDFFSQPGRAALCTAHGDVWLIDGLDEDFDRIQWRRFATGLFQPLGLKIVDDTIYVLGRDQITRLHDRDGNGEADFYECFNNDAETSAGGHDYSTCLETDPAGNFYYISHRGVHRVSADGSTYETIATGFRNSNGMSVGPDGTITAAPQEGNWTPVSAVFEVREGGYYGFGGPKVTPDRPLGYDPPICWIPRLLDNSTGGQVWVTSDRWGPLEGQLLNLSFGQCRMLLTLREQVGDVTQGGSIAFPLHFDSGVMRGRFSPHDGQLYVSGLRGWVSAAVQDGCLQRVRYTGAPVDLPTGVTTYANGIALTFASPLDPDTAEDPGRFAVQQWNYRYSSAYGSPELSVADQQQEGRDDVEVISATLLDDRTVFLEISDVQPVMQMGIRYALRAADGTSIRDTYYHTINAVRPDGIDPARLTRNAPQGRLTQQITDSLQPGFLWKFRPLTGTTEFADARASRLVTLSASTADSVTPFIEPGPFEARGSGYIRMPLPAAATFRVEGRGSIRLRINDQDVLGGRGEDLSLIARRTVQLNGGYNRIEVDYLSPQEGQARLRLLWESEDHPLEPVPPTVLFHAGDDPLLVESDQLRSGRELFAVKRCHRCHAMPVRPSGDRTMHELSLAAPRLDDLGKRLHPHWIAAWLTNPPALRNRTTMPHVLSSDAATARQQALDLAAWLTGGTIGSGEDVASASRSVTEDGEILFEDLGCIACHRFTPPDEDDDFDRVSLAFAAAKLQPGALVAFLQQPHRHFRTSPMPDFALSAEEATALAAFIRSESEGELPEWSADAAGNSERGRELFVSLKCAACHGTPDSDSRRDSSAEVTSVAVVPVAGWPQSQRGCLGEPASATHKGPRYRFTDDERIALNRFLETGGRSLLQPAVHEAAARTIRRLRCTACHDRDASRAIRGPVIIEEGSRGIPPERLPSLTWAGDKLHSDWLHKQFTGELPQRTRTWLTARMPAFPADATVLTEGLAAQHGLADSSAEPPAAEPSLIETGKRLTARDALDCRQCHGVGPLEPRGDDRTKIAPGINFKLIRQRVRPDFYTLFVLDPPRYDIGTKMPKLTTDGRTTRVTGILDGDARKQFEALWQYIHHFDHEAGDKPDSP
ncbi:DUF6797 domain-containing protein [Maioricimonas rarisocia]|nr:DUF6797 domain-containing protein [Maioricimonas rarisocia]